MDIVLKMLLLGANFKLLLAEWQANQETGRTIIYLEDEKPINVVKPGLPLGPLGYGYKFYTQHQLSNKKFPPSSSNFYVSQLGHGSSGIKLVTDSEDLEPEVSETKKCCGNEWAGDEQEVLQDGLYLHNPVPSPLSTQSQHLRLYYEDDVKPVTELIEDDIKYDFRTKIHSIDK